MASGFGDKVLPHLSALSEILFFPDADYQVTPARFPFAVTPNANFLNTNTRSSTRQIVRYPPCEEPTPRQRGAGPHPMNKLGRMRVSWRWGTLLRPGTTQL
ncbi:MAG: hypothetical protein Ct9H300mP8_11190 [Gammaproteobacteria bacterium]|nr:MAG: hypothetical protein Ct9H300mP8_11190 [Gammaproteobacteria bacterium]